MSTVSRLCSRVQLQPAAASANKFINSKLSTRTLASLSAPATRQCASPASSRATAISNTVSSSAAAASNSARRVLSQSHSTFITSPAPATTTPPAMSNQPSPSFVLTLSCVDRPGVVHQITGVLANNELNILESAQYGDPSTGSFFLRVHFAPTPDASNKTHDITSLKSIFEPVCSQKFEQATWDVHSANYKPKVVVLVSKIGHCLNSLLFAKRSGAVGIDIPLVISNHPDYAELCKSSGIPFVHTPITKETKAEVEAHQLKLIAEAGADLVVMARYMQILSDDFVKNGPPVINVHHALLPAFKGGKPYFQAHDKGVKLIGATAHFASADLDEGPIIEQEVERVNHSMGPKELTQIGSHVEAIVLERAVKWFAEQRILMNGAKTIVFS